MEIKIEIKGDIFEKKQKLTPLQINQFEEIALFLDCPTVQGLIEKFRKKITLKEMNHIENSNPWIKKIEAKTSLYTNYDEWKKNIIIKYESELSKEDLQILYNLNSDIADLENKEQRESTQTQLRELKDKIYRRNSYFDFYNLFSMDVKKELIILKKPSFHEILIKAILTGKISDEDWQKLTTTKKGSRVAIFKQREWYWTYRNFKSKANSNKGYGKVGKKFDINLRTVISGVKSYEEKVNTYDSSLHSF